MKKKKIKESSKEENEEDQTSGLDIRNIKDLWSFIKVNKIYFGLIVLFTLLIYANIITGDFVNLDDYSKLLADPQYGNLGESLKSLDLYRIIMTLFIKSFGIKSTPLHILSIIFHILNGFLAFILLYILFGKKYAILGTLMFLSHPTNTEAISWHAGFPYPLRASVILPVLIFFALYKKGGGKKFLYISSAIYIFGLIFLRGGGWMLVTPFLAVFMDQFILEDKIKFKNIVQYLPFLITSLIFFATLIPGYLQERVEGLETLYYVDTESATPLMNRIPYTIYMEFKTLFFPTTLSIYHEGKYIGPGEYTFMVSVSIAIIFGIFYFMKRDRRLSGLILMILFSILPSFSPVIVAWIAAERYLYIASIFSSVMILIGLSWLDDKVSKNKNGKKKTSKESNLVLYAAITIILLYSVRTIVRNVDLRNSKNLWIATRKTAPYSYRVYNNMGDVLANEGDYEGAIENFKRSVALKTDYADAVHNIGHIYMVKKDYVRAKRYLEQSLQMNPRLYPSAYKLAVMYTEEGNYEKAKEYLEMCLSVETKNADCAGLYQRINTITPQR